jgi:crotonobetainyl-CoA:carnitine CoA-transferase CaiB-like acyl-CoA transferase
MTTPLQGKIRVLDLSMGWAGPLAAQLLAEMGAEVIKVEDTHYIDWWRGSLSMGPPELQVHERAPTFNSANRGKLGVTLDLGNPRGIEIVKRLASISDVLIENYSPGVMARFGVDWDALTPLNERLVMLSMPSFGYGGPETNSRGYGNTVEAMAGVTTLNRYHDAEQPYTLSNALGDPVSGITGAFAVLAALHERQRTGRGQWIELAQVEAAIPLLAEPIIDLQLTAAAPRARSRLRTVSTGARATTTGSRSRRPPMSNGARLPPHWDAASLRATHASPARRGARPTRTRSTLRSHARSAGPRSMMR